MELSSPTLTLRGREHSNCTPWAQRIVEPKRSLLKITLLDFLYGEGSSTFNRGGVRLQRKWGSRHTSSWHAPQHNQERRIAMDPTTVFCPTLACPARGQTGQGNIGIHSQKEQRFICHACHKTFSATKGTAFYRLRTAAETVAL